MKKKFNKKKIDHETTNANENTTALSKIIDSSLIVPKTITREKTILNENDKRNLNEKAVLLYLKIQKEKTEFEDTIEEEYIEKVIMYGFLVVSKYN